MNKTTFNMGIQLFILVNLLVIITAKVVPVKDKRCPQNEGPNSKLVLLPHKTDCRKYYSCSKGYRVEMDCPPGLVFNDNLKVCDWPYNFSCSIPSNDYVEIPDIIWRAHEV